MSLDSTQIPILCLAAFITAVNAWVVFITRKAPSPSTPPLRGPRAPPPPTSAEGPGLLKEVPNDEGPYVDFAPFLKGCRCRCRCHCQATQVWHFHTSQRRPSGNGVHGPLSNLQPNSVAANHPHRVKNAKRRAKHRQSKC